MAVTYTTVALVKKKMKEVSASLLDADIEENIYEAEGLIDLYMRLSGRGSTPDFTFDPVKHSSIRNCCTEVAAFYTMIYDPEGTFLTLADAEFTANLLWVSSDGNLEELADSRTITYLKGL